MSMWACPSCGYVQVKWFSRCPSCYALVSAQEGGIASAYVAGHQAPLVMRDAAEPREPLSTTAIDGRGTRERVRPIAITDVPDEWLERISTGIPPVDLVLGGGLVPASFVLLGALPGCGKSTLLAQLLAQLVRVAPGWRALYATGEESIAQAAMRARRIDASDARISIMAETDIDVIIEEARAIRATSKLVLVVDSVQCVSTETLGSIPGSVAQVKECAARLMRLAKLDDVVVIAIGHVTKDGTIGGPQTLAHIVDVVLSLSAGDEEYGGAHLRFLAAPTKNRFGSTMERGVLQMTDKGLIAVDGDDAALAAIEAHAEQDLRYEPLAQELLNRYLANGGKIDKGLADRIGDALDYEQWMETRYTGKLPDKIEQTWAVEPELNEDAPATPLEQEGTKT